jgi:hypothetical protein
VPLQAVVVTPLAVFADTQADEQRKMPWNCLCSHHDGNRLPAVAELDIVVFPPAGQTAGTLVRHATWMCDFGPSRAIWYNTLPDESDEIELRSCTIFTHVDAHAGYMRLGRSKAPDPSRLFSIPITGQTGAIRDLTWEEQSGLICILVCRRNGEGHGIET